MKLAKLLCAVMAVLAAIHFLIAFRAIGIDQGAGTDVFFAGYFANPWQAVINFDLMAGLTLVAAWVLWREPDRAAALTWILVIFYWGNLVVAIYAWRQLTLSGGSWERFFLGRYARDAVATQRRSLPMVARLALWLLAALIAVFVVERCQRVGLQPAPLMGYIWGLGCFVPVCLLLARGAPRG